MLGGFSQRGVQSEMTFDVAKVRLYLGYALGQSVNVLINIVYEPPCKTSKEHYQSSYRRKVVPVEWRFEGWRGSVLAAFFLLVKLRAAPISVSSHQSAYLEKNSQNSVAVKPLMVL